MPLDTSLYGHVSRSRAERWRGSLLQHLLLKIAEAADEEWALSWAYQLGERWAADVTASIDPDADFDDIAKALSSVWQRDDWGQTEFAEGKQGWEVIHHHGPFVEILGAERLLLAAELMRGFYAALLRGLSENADLDLVLDEGRSGLERLCFQVSAAS